MFHVSDIISHDDDFNSDRRHLSENFFLNIIIIFLIHRYQNRSWLIMYFEHPYYPNKYEQYENIHHPSAILNAIQILLGSIQLNVVFFLLFFSVSIIFRTQNSMWSSYRYEEKCVIKYTAFTWSNISNILCQFSVIFGDLFRTRLNVCFGYEWMRHQ